MTQHTTHMIFERGESYESGAAQVACGDRNKSARISTRDRQEVTCSRCLEAIREEEGRGRARRTEHLGEIERLTAHVLAGPDGRFKEGYSFEPPRSKYISPVDRANVAVSPRPAP